MVMGYVIWRACQSTALRSARVLTPAIPPVWVAALYIGIQAGAA